MTTDFSRTELALIQESIDRFMLDDDLTRKTKLLTAINYAMDGALTDGTYYKQYGLIKIIKLLMGDNYGKWIDLLEKNCYFIDEGMPG